MSTVKPITIHIDSKDYTLEYNRDSIRFAESRGFDVNDVARFPMTKGYELIWYAFRMHHKNVSKQQSDKIIDDMFGGIGDIPAEFMERLGALYNVPFEAMAPGEDEPKNLRGTWE